MTSIACIIVGIDNWQKYTLPLIESIREHEPSCSIVVVDNASSEPYPRIDLPLRNLNIHRTERLCYSAAINYGKSCFWMYSIGSTGVHETTYDWYIVLSNDVICTGPFAHMLVEYGDGDIIGPLLKEVYGYPYLEGWAVFIPRRAWDAIGGWDENFKVSSWEDVDFSTSALEKGFGLTEDRRLPFTHLDQKQRFNLIANYWESEAHNQAYFMQKHGSVRKGTVYAPITEQTLVTHEIHLGDVSFKIQDYAASLTTAFVLRELAMNNYGLNGRTFKDGDVLLDIGANVGVVSIWLAKQLPKCTIYAYEPLSVNFENLRHNIELNDVANVIPMRWAVTADRQPLTMHYNYDNLGGASGFMGQPPWNETEVDGITLQDIFEAHHIDRVALLKMDIEGAEHEVLAGCNGLLDRVDYLAMEAHFTPKLRLAGWNERTLQRVLQPLIARGAARVTVLEAGA